MKSGLKDNIIIVGVILLALFSVYKYWVGLVKSIEEKDRALIELREDIVKIETDKLILENRINSMLIDVEIQKDICEIRVETLAESYDKELSIFKTSIDIKKKASENIKKVLDDSSKTEDMKRLEILNIEYDLLAGGIEL